MKALSWKDEKAMIKQDVELHLEWHKRQFSDWAEMKKATVKEFAKALISRRMAWYQTPQYNYVESGWGKIQFGYNGCQFNIFDNAKSLALFYQGLNKRI